MKKVLFVATVSNHIASFHLPFLNWFKQQGYVVHVAANGNSEIPFCDRVFSLPIERAPIKRNNIKAYLGLKKIIDAEKYDIIHCHTPMGGALSRLAARDARRKGTKVIYTAHGFHFFKGAKIVNWMIYYPVEKWLAHYTDCLITINQEDYDIARKKNFKAKRIKYIPGVGVNLEKFQPKSAEEKKTLRVQYGYNEENFIVIYVGELSQRKNQAVIMKAAHLLKEKVPELIVLLVGDGELLDEYKKTIRKLGIEKQVEFLGFRRDVDSLMAISDVGVSTAKQEGLPVNVMEAMATGLPLVVTNCRGNRDLVVDNETGFVVNQGEIQRFSDAIESLYKKEDLRKKFGEQGRLDAQKYSIRVILKQMETVYIECIADKY